MWKVNGRMAPAERKKVILKQKSCSLENKRESKESKQVSRKGEGRLPLMASKEYEEKMDKNREAVRNNIISNSNNSRNNNNVVERACSEDRGLRRRPKVCFPFFIVILFLSSKGSLFSF